MPLLVDALNVLHAPMPASLGELDVARLCLAIGRTPWARQGAVVVCDAAPGPLGLLESPAEGVELVYSGHGRTADEEIIRRIDASSAPRNLIVVSSDHAIRDAARRRRATTWASDEFLLRLAEALRPPPGPAEPEKPPANALAEDDVQRWLDAFGFDESGKPRPPDT